MSYRVVSRIAKLANMAFDSELKSASIVYNYHHSPYNLLPFIRIFIIFTDIFFICSVTGVVAFSSDVSIKNNLMN